LVVDIRRAVVGDEIKYSGGLFRGGESSQGSRQRSAKCFGCDSYYFLARAPALAPAPAPAPLLNKEKLDEVEMVTEKIEEQWTLPRS
jgi:hypothetical protein